jgi:hypothetical protein
MNSPFKLIIIGNNAAVLLCLNAAIVDPSEVVLKGLIIIKASIEEYHPEHLLFTEFNHLRRVFQIVKSY